MSGALVDTNLFVYAFDPADPIKHQQAIRLIDEVGREGDLVVSVQVLNELAWTLLRKGASLGLAPGEVHKIIDEIARSARVLPLTPELTSKALTVGLGHGLSFWDALIWAAARRHEVTTIFSEDFQHGREVEGVRFVNPFLPE